MTTETPEIILIERASQERVQAAAIGGLPVIFREALLLCEVEEMSYQEIAETLSIPIGTGDVTLIPRSYGIAPSAKAKSPGGQAWLAIHGRPRSIGT